MYRVNVVTINTVVNFAAEELKKYLRMMMPECGEIFINYDRNAKDGLRLGLMSDFGLDTSEAEDTVLDDILHIDTNGENGIIAGSNPRSVLLAVYRYLRENGCFWLFPGIDGEYVPVRTVGAVKYHKMAECRYRGQCNEGAEFQQNMMDVIDFTSKIGMNVFMLEFDTPKAYYDHYYNHKYNTANRAPEPVNATTVKQWKRQCEAEMAKRGLQFHDMGHGWTAEPFGISSVNGWVKEADNPVPEEYREMLAMTNGVRELWNGVALNTQFCMSTPKARAVVADYIVQYAKMHQNVDYLHVWLADGAHNHCECEECIKKTPSDYYVMLLNDIDERLTAAGLDTRIVFICYTDTTWAPLTEKFANTKRFSFMLAAITRLYSSPVPENIPAAELAPYERNKADSFPVKVEDYILHSKEWKRAGECPSLVYEYHFWVHQHQDPGMMKFSKLIHDDIRGYRKNGFDGLIEDGSQRSYFPNGFNFFVYAETLFDTNVNYESLKREYFSHAYGEITDDVIAYFTEISETYDTNYIAKNLNAAVGGDRSGMCFHAPEKADAFRKVKDITAKYAPIFESHKNMEYRAQTVAMRLLCLHMEYAERMADIWALVCEGKLDEALAAVQSFANDFGKYEFEIETYFDHRMCFYFLDLLMNSFKNFYSAN